jgi:hypothetical protein
VADKSTQLILTALSRAAAGGEVPLYASKSAAGLFPTTAAGKQAAVRCQEQGYLALLTSEAGGSEDNGGATATLVKKKTAAPPRCRITPAGLAYLLGEVSPRQVLDDFVRALEARRQQMAELVQAARQMQQELEVVKAQAAAVLQQVQNAEASVGQGNGTGGSLKTLFSGFRQEQAEPEARDCSAAVLAELERWEASGSLEDCDLAHLFRQMQAARPDLTIGQMHDTLRALCAAEKVYLHPWTGPLYEIPEPAYALLTGHGIDYYASRRGG